MQMSNLSINALRLNLQPSTKTITPKEQRYFHGATFSIEDNSLWGSAQPYLLYNRTSFTTVPPLQPYLLYNRTSFTTVFAVNPGDEIDITWLRDRIARYTETDDVFRTEFLTGIILQGTAKSQLNVNLDPNELLREWGNEWVKVHSFSEQSPPLSPGPYAIQNGELLQIWRLYSDNNLAFLQSVWPTTTTLGEYTNVPYTGRDHRTLSIAVPSKLCSSHPDSLPLDGLRISIKDLYHLRGVRTSLCSRAYNALYPPESTTSETIAHLISLGVHIVGKNHLSSFALQEHPTQSVDYEAPFNPRADGYQIPGGSSSGSASAVASYDWLDFAIATDATGSVRIPAFANGCFGLRPSAGAVSTEGVVSVYPGFDVPGLLGRDLERFHDFIRHWYGQGPGEKPLSSPKLLFPPDFMTLCDTAQKEMIEDFVSDLEKSLSTVAERKSIAATWSQSSPVEEEDLDVYLQNVGETQHMMLLLMLYRPHFIATTSRHFRKSYENKFGRKPFVTEVIRWMWNLGSQCSREQYDDMNERLLIFKRWFLKEYMKEEEQDSILILPISKAGPTYRDIYPGVPSAATTGLRQTYLSPYLGVPEIAIPIGHIKYESRISGKLEHLPVAVSLMGPPGSDLALVQLSVASLRASGRPIKVRAGTARMWEDDSQGVFIHPGKAIERQGIRSTENVVCT